MKTRLITFIAIQFLIVSTGYCIKKSSNFNDSTYQYKRILELNSWGSLKNHLFIYRAEGSYRLKLNNNFGFIGAKVGFQSYGTYSNKLRIGPIYTYYFNINKSTPFIELDLYGERTNLKSSQYSFYKEEKNLKYFGVAGMLFAGYKLSFKNRKYGITGMYGIGASTKKEIVENGLSEYEVKLDNYLLFGFICQF